MQKIDIVSGLNNVTGVVAILEIKGTLLDVQPISLLTAILLSVTYVLLFSNLCKCFPICLASSSLVQQVKYVVFHCR